MLPTSGASSSLCVLVFVCSMVYMLFIVFVCGYVVCCAVLNLCELYCVVVCGAVLFHKNTDHSSQTSDRKNSKQAQ